MNILPDVTLSPNPHGSWGEALMAWRRAQELHLAAGKRFILASLQYPDRDETARSCGYARAEELSESSFCCTCFMANAELARLVLQILAKAEMLNPGGSVKDRVALQVVQEALAEGRLRPGGLITEGTAGRPFIPPGPQHGRGGHPAEIPSGVHKALTGAAICCRPEIQSWDLHTSI